MKTLKRIEAGHYVGTLNVVTQSGSETFKITVLNGGIWFTNIVIDEIIYNLHDLYKTPILRGFNTLKETKEWLHKFEYQCDHIPPRDIINQNLQAEKIEKRRIAAVGMVALQHLQNINGQIRIDHSSDDNIVTNECEAFIQTEHRYWKNHSLDFYRVEILIPKCIVDDWIMWEDLSGDE